MSQDSESDVLACSERSVSFSTIEFHEHAMILGVSPSTTHGPPLEIDWEKFNSSTYDLNEYEELRPPRRVKEQLIMPGVIREEVLLVNGYTKNQINHHLQQMKEERLVNERSTFKKIPIRVLSRARQSFFGALVSSKT